MAEILWRRLPAPTGARVAVAATFLVVCLTMSQQSIAQEAANSTATLSRQLVHEAGSLIDESIQNGFDRDKVDQIFRRATLSDGSVENLLAWLAESRGDITQPRGQVIAEIEVQIASCLLYTSPSPRDKRQSRMPSSA